MKTHDVISLALVGLLPCVIGCTSALSLDQELVTTTRVGLEKTNGVQLPSNCNKQNFKSLKMGVAIEDLPVMPGKEAKPLPSLVKARIEGDLIKVNRFSIVPVQDEGGQMFFADLADVDGNVSVKKQVKPNELDLILTMRLQWTKQVIDLHDGGKRVFLYTVSGQSQCRDQSTGLAVPELSQSVKGIAKRSQVYNVQYGKVVSGFDHTSPDALNEVLVSASKRMLTILFSKIGNVYPIGGEITTCDRHGESFTLNKGTENGVGDEGQQFTVFVDDEGQDVALCYATAQAGKEKSTLIPWRWNEEQKTAVEIREEFMENPRKFVKEHKVYAAGHGLSMPAKWDTDGEIKDLTRLQER